MDAILFIFTHLVSWGIFNCREVNHPNGGGNLSVHGEGRALDVHGSFESMQQLVDVLLTRVMIDGVSNTIAGHIGFQFLIFNHKKYGCEWGWAPRAYGGYAHEDHVHGELPWATARLGREAAKTRAIRLLKGEQEDDMAQVPQDAWDGLVADVADLRKDVASIATVTGTKLYGNRKTLLASVTKTIDDTPGVEGGERHVEAIDFFADVIIARIADVHKKLNDDIDARLVAIEQRLAAIEAGG